MRAIFVVLLAVAPLLVAAEEFYYENIIVGAGPSGVQLALYMTQAKRDFIMLERSDTVGNFFNKFPIHGKLISVMKRYTGTKNKEFRLRHDWNSLMTDDESLRYENFSPDYFPRSLTMVDYVRAFVEKQNIGPIRYNTLVSNVRPEMNLTLGRDTFALDDQNGNTWRCKTLVIATGHDTPVAPKFEGVEYAEQYVDLDISPESFKNKRVMILGNGNSAFEVADTALQHAILVHMISRSRIKMAFNTHYVGNVRATNMEFLDNYLLKSLGGILELNVEKMRFPRVNNGTQFMFWPASPELKKVFSSNNLDYPIRQPYDRLILCLGFRFNHSLFSEKMPFKFDARNKYPHVYQNYESVEQPGLFFAGTIVHSLDVGKASGAFIAGLRYTAGALFQLLEYRNHDIKWPSNGKLPMSGLINKVLLRMTESSDMWHMKSFWADIIFIRDGGDTFEYIEKLPVNLIADLEKHTGRKPDKEGVIVAILHFGLNYTGDVKDTMAEGRNRFQPSTAFTARLLHPCFYYYKTLPTQADFDARAPRQILPRPDRVHYLVDDAHVTWDNPRRHLLVTRRYMEKIFQRDIRAFYAEDCMVYAMTHKTIPHTCQYNKHLNQKGIIRGSY